MTNRSLLHAITDTILALRYRLEYRIRGRDYRMPLDRAARLCSILFERQLRRRGIRFAFDEDTETYRIDCADGMEGTISLSNVTRELAGDGDTNRIIQFADNMLVPASYPDDWSKVKHRALWTIQPNTLVRQSHLVFHLSDQTHQVPALWDPQTKQLLMLESHMLLKMSISEEAVAEAANEYLSVELRNAELIVRELEGVKAGFIHCRFPFKAALILAPNLREVAEPILGWPVIPNRNTLCLFDADDFYGVSGIFEVMPGLGGWVLDQYELGAYPLSTEIFEISGQGVRAVAEYSRHPPTT